MVKSFPEFAERTLLVHEMSLAMELLSQVLDAAESARAKVIDEVVVHCGTQRMVVHDAMQTAWVAVSEGTLAHGARLLLEDVPMEARCNLCMHDFLPEIDDYQCPRCKEADIVLLRGADIILASVACLTEGG